MISPQLSRFTPINRQAHPLRSSFACFTLRVSFLDNVGECLVLPGVICEERGQTLEAEAFYRTTYDLLVRHFPASDTRMAHPRYRSLTTNVSHPFALILFDRWIDFLLKQQRTAEAMSLSLQFSMTLIRYPVPGKCPSYPL